MSSLPSYARGLIGRQNSGAFLGATKETKTPLLAPSGPAFFFVFPVRGRGKGAGVRAGGRGGVWLIENRRNGQERKISPKRKFLTGYPSGHPAKNFGQALQILVKQAFWHGRAARTSTKKLRSEKLRADFSLAKWGGFVLIRGGVGGGDMGLESVCGGGVGG